MLFEFGLALLTLIGNNNISGWFSAFKTNKVLKYLDFCIESSDLKLTWKVSHQLEKYTIYLFTYYTYFKYTTINPKNCSKSVLFSDKFVKTFL